MIAGEAAFAALALRDYLEVGTTPDAVHQTGEEADMGGSGGGGGRKGGGHRAWTREEERGRDPARRAVEHSDNLFVDCLVLDFEEVRIRIDDLALFLVSALLLLLTIANGRLRAGGRLPDA